MSNSLPKNLYSSNLGGQLDKEHKKWKMISVCNCKSAKSKSPFSWILLESMWALNTNCVIVFEYQTQSLFRKESINFYQKKLFFQKLIRKQKIMKQLLQGLLPQKTAQPCKTLKLLFHRLWCYNSYCDWLPHFEIISSKNIVKHKKS